MAIIVPISKRGAVTLPPALRRKLGLEGEEALVIIEEREGELVLRPAAAVPVRTVSVQEVEAWIAEDEEGFRRFEATEPGG
jgi:AbrB family looped-hinge helix DNA binding protein